MWQGPLGRAPPLAKVVKVPWPNDRRSFKLGQPDETSRYRLLVHGFRRSCADEVGRGYQQPKRESRPGGLAQESVYVVLRDCVLRPVRLGLDRKSTRLNSSHLGISY